MFLSGTGLSLGFFLLNQFIVQDLVCLFLPGTGLSLRIYLQMLANCVHQEVIIQVGEKILLKDLDN